MGEAASGPDGAALRPGEADAGQRGSGGLIAALACVLALGSADQGALGAAAAPIKESLDIGNSEIGVLAAVVPAVGLVTTVPAGALADRVRRTRLLAVALLLSAAAMVANGAAPSYHWLLASRIAFGAVSAAVAPVIASLIGDYFPAGGRGRAYGFILSGELVGTGFGYVVCGGVAAVASWRWSFWVLVPISLVLISRVIRMPEPARGATVDAPAGADDPAARMSTWAALRYVLGVRTNAILIVASAMLYFFLAVLRTFAAVFAREQYNVGQAMATMVLPLVGLGAVIGVLAGGRLGDRLMAAGRWRGRIAVGVIGYGLAVVLFIPAFSSSALLIALPLFFVASAALGLLNPPLDAARLDVIHHRMWGRSEGVRTAAMLSATTVAPLLFGFLSEPLGLENTFLAMLISLTIAAVLLVAALGSYQPDVEAAQSLGPRR